MKKVNNDTNQNNTIKEESHNQIINKKKKKAKYVIENENSLFQSALKTEYTEKNISGGKKEYNDVGGNSMAKTNETGKHKENNGQGKHKKKNGNDKHKENNSEDNYKTKNIKDKQKEKYEYNDGDKYKEKTKSHLDGKEKPKQKEIDLFDLALNQNEYKNKRNDETKVSNSKIQDLFDKAHTQNNYSVQKNGNEGSKATKNKKMDIFDLALTQNSHKVVKKEHDTPSTYRNQDIFDVFLNQVKSNKNKTEPIPMYNQANAEISKSKINSNNINIDQAPAINLKMEETVKTKYQPNYYTDTFSKTKKNNFVGFLEKEETFHLTIEGYRNEIDKMIKDCSIVDNIREQIELMVNQTEDCYKYDENIDLKIEEKTNNLEEYTQYRNRIIKIYDYYKQSENLVTMRLIYKLLKREQSKVLAGLPIYSKRSKILKTISSNQCTIIIGETGSGKSTQLCQFIADENILGELDHRGNLNIVPSKLNKKICVTQPRKLATKTLAERVSKEMNDEILCRAGIKDKNNVSNNALIEYCTDRIILEEIIKDKYLNKYSHIIIDEAHERNLFTDIILGMIKYALTQRKDLKVIVTSATMDEKLFSGFFEKAPIIKVSGRMYHLSVKYLSCPLDDNESYRNKICRKTVEIVDSINESIDQNDYSNYGHILIFCSGVDDITKLTIRLEELLRGKYCKVFQLHGNISYKEQNMIFEEIQEIKVILSTRIAETSITIKGIKYVIDIGYDIESYYDPIKKLTTFQVNTITRSSANQRAGRGCRTGPGICYRLYTQECYDNMHPFKIPEIKRSNLSIVSLKLKQFKIKKIQEFSFIEKPDEITLSNSIEELKLLGAFDEIENITPLGIEMAELPTDPWLSKIIIEASIRNCQEEIIRIISILQNSTSLFFIYHKDFNENKRDELDKIKIEFSDEFGDLIMLLNIFNRCYATIENNPKNSKPLIQFCKEKKINIKSFKQALHLYHDLKHSLKGKKNITKKIVDEKKNENPDEKKKVKITPEDMIQEYKKRLNLTSKYNENQKEQFKLNDIINIEKIAEKVNLSKNEDSLKVNIVKCFLSSYFQNLCRYSGNEDIGYTLLRELMPIKIQDPSCLCLSQNFPRWIFCFEIVNNSLLNSTKLASVCDIKWIEEVVPKKFLKYYKLLDYDINPLYQEIELKQVPTLFLKSIRNPYTVNLKKTVPFLEQNKITAKVDLENNIAIFWTLRNKNEVFNEWMEFCNQYKHDCSCFVKEIMLNNDKKIIIGAGLRVTDVVNADDFIRINCVLPKKINDEIQIYNLLRFDKNKMHVKKIDRLTLKEENEYQLTFNKASDATEAFNILLVKEKQYKSHFQLECTKKLNVDEAFKDRFINANVKFFFSIGYSTLKGMIKGQYQFLKKIKNNFSYINGSSLVFNEIKVENSNQATSKLYFNGLKIHEDEFDVFNHLKSVLNRFDLIKVFRSKEIDSYLEESLQLEISEKIDYFSYYKEVMKKTKYPKSIEDFNRIMKEDYNTDLVLYKAEFDQTNKQNKDLLDPDITLKEISFNVNHLNDINYFIQKFNNKFSVFGDGKTRIVINYKARIYIIRKKFNQIKLILEKLRLKYLQKYKQLSIILPKQNQDYKSGDMTLSDRITLLSPNNQEELVEAKTELMEFINGKLISNFEYFKLLVLFQNSNYLKMSNIERDYNCYIENNEEAREIRIIGEPENIEKAIPEILKIVENSKISSKIIDFKGKNISKLLKDKMKLKKELESKFHCRIEINLRSKKIFIYGKEQEIEEASDKILSTLCNWNTNPVDIYLCELCDGEITNGYRLITCEHIFCFGCLKEYIIQSKNDVNNYPIKCPCDYCTKFICFADLRYLVQDKELDLMYDKALDQFISCNKTYVAYCPRNFCKNVILFKKEIDRASCSSCNIIIPRSSSSGGPIKYY